MADKTISALTAATTPLVGNETVPLVQSGTTKKVSVDNLTAGKAVSALSMTATNLKTSPVTANLDISGTTIAAAGSDANVDVNINAKGSGVAYLNATNLSVTGTTISAGFYTVKSSTSLSSTPATLFTCGGSAALYYVGVTWNAGNPAAFTANAIIIWDGSNARIMQSTNGTQVIISLSGADVQAVNNFTTATADWSYMKQSIA